MFCGPIPLTKIRNEVRSRFSQGWILSIGATSPGSTLNNYTYVSAPDKTFRASLVFSRGTTFLSIAISYSSPLAVLLGAILGNFSGIMSLGTTIMRMVESLHQRNGDPNSLI